jgi:hypothetical protein
MQRCEGFVIGVTIALALERALLDPQAPAIYRTTIGAGATFTSAASGDCGPVSTRSTTRSSMSSPQPSSSTSPTATGGGT